MSQVERRRHPRVSVNLALRLTFKDRTVETVISDLSNSGIRFRAPTELPLLSRVQIGLELPEPQGAGGSASLAITGVVVRSDPIADAQSPFDTAIYFEDLSDGARAKIARFVGSRTA